MRRRSDEKEGSEGGPTSGPPFAGWFGRHRGGPFARRASGRIFDSGALRLVTLGLIADEPRHGYDVMRAIAARFRGAYAPSPGSIYPILQALVEAGLVTSSSWGPRKLYTIAAAGQVYLAGRRSELAAIEEQIRQAAAPIAASSVEERIGAFRTSLMEKMRRGGLNEAKARELGAILDRARKEIEDL